MPSLIPVVPEAAAQQLSPALCPAGGPNPFNIRPTLARFAPGQGIPLLRRTIDPATYPDARCNDGSPAVIYLRPANAAYAGNPITDASSRWVIMLDGGGGCRNPDDCLLTRWCSWGSAPLDRAGKMSSRGAWPAISVDAAVAPGMWAPGISWADPYSPGDWCDHLLSVAEPAVRGFWSADDSALDQSCLDPAWTADHDAIGGSHPQACYDTTYTLLAHITTPVFVRMDIDDPLAKRSYGQWNLIPAIDDYWSALFAQLDDFSAYTPTAAWLQTPLQTPGIQGPNCTRHVALQSNDGFFRHRVTGPGVPQHPFHDLIVNWAAGLGPGLDTQQIHADNLGAGAYSPFFCA